MRRNGLIDEAEELEPFLVTVPFLAQTEHLTISGIQGGEQGRRAIALVIMRHSLATSGFERQAGLGAVKGLDLTLLIQAKHHGMLGRIQIQTDYILQFLDELGIVADLESFDQMGLQTVGTPDTAYAGLTDAHRLGHRAGAPL